MGAIQADTPLRYIKGVGPARADQLQRLGLATVEDLLLVPGIGTAKLEAIRELVRVH